MSRRLTKTPVTTTVANPPPQDQTRPKRGFAAEFMALAFVVVPPRSGTTTPPTTYPSRWRLKLPATVWTGDKDPNQLHRVGDAWWRHIKML